MIDEAFHTILAFVQSMAAAGAGGFAGLTTTQILIGLGCCIAGLFLIKTIFTPGGPRGRMKTGAAVWVVVPLIVAVSGAIVWVIINLFKHMNGGFTT